MSPDQLEIEQRAALANTTLAGALAVDILARRDQALRDRTSSYPRSHSILSDIGECDRQMVYSVTNWKDRPAIDPNLKARFEIGNLLEREIVSELRTMGYDVILQQEPVEIKDRGGAMIGRGKIDGHIKYHGIKIPIEIKSMHPSTYEQIDSLEDFRKKPHLRKYLRQMAMYLYGNNVEEGLFILTDCLGHWKVFVLALDFAEGEQILQRLERVHNHLKAATQPDRIEYRSEICGKCPFAMVCIPDIIRKEINVLVDEDLLANLERRDAAAVASSAFTKADKWVKTFLKGHKIEKGIAGDFIITSKLMPAKKPSEKTPEPYMKYDIERVSEIGKDKEAV